MTDANDELLFNQSYCARIRDLRTQRGWTAEQMATALGVPPDRYRKYEVRSPMPIYLVERFALIVGQDVHYVVTGKTERRPIVQPPSPSAIRA
jgi:DNA-binding XRE family transcriptional regulator